MTREEGLLWRCVRLSKKVKGKVYGWRLAKLRWREKVAGDRRYHGGVVRFCEGDSMRRIIRESGCMVNLEVHSCCIVWGLGRVWHAEEERKVMVAVFVVVWWRRWREG